MAFTEKQLAQSRPAGTTAASVYSPGASTTAVIKTIFVANTSGAGAKFRLFLDDNGTTYDETTALFWDTPVDADATVQIDTTIAMNDASGNLAFRTDTGNALTITVIGAEIT